MLTKDARIPFSKIGRKIGVSTNTVNNRYNKLVENGTIQRTILVYDLKKCGFVGSVLMLVKLLPESSFYSVFEAPAKKIYV